MADYFDRLIARHAPASAVAVSPGGADGAATARVRPRLPGPYERIEALRAPEPFLDEPGPLLAAPPDPAPVPERFLVREIRTTDRETVVRGTEPAPRAEPDRPAAPPAAAPLLRPATPLTPGPRPAAFDAPGTGRRAAAPSPAREGTRRPVTPEPGVPFAAAARAAMASSPLPSATAGPATDRAAARTAAVRRRPNAAERVVHVQIGRLEVSAAEPPGRRPAARPEQAGRRGPALSLDDYLSRGEKRG
ncbi:hypothetical protein [Streptomyces sp. NPDC059850]|uniref:hypothetical protein n=1 Tax=Streptomyces sp. NPDC059850 TaxID=3346970 RepID=UPI00365D6AC6